MMTVEFGMMSVEWSPTAIINEELRILHSNIAAMRESFNIQHSTFLIHNYRPSQLSGLSLVVSLRNWNCKILSAPTRPKA